MIQKAKILFFCMIFAITAVFAQKTDSIKPIIAPQFLLADYKYCPHDSIYFYNSATAKNNLQTTSPLPSISIISANYYTQNFGFFCKKELQLQKAIKFPFVFRLGSVEQCNRLEGKRNAKVMGQ
jgi:hypothetical protein